MELESLIRSYVKLGQRSAKGFEPCVCAACNDHKPRGGFKFDGSICGFFCFNCGMSAKFDPSTHSLPSKKFRNLLSAFGIPDEELSKAIGKTFIDHIGSSKAEQRSDKPAWSPPKTVELPKQLHLVTDDGSPWCEVARTYLRERSLDPACYPFMVSDEPRYTGRVIIPFYHRERPIYFQGRSMVQEVQPRYLNPTADKDKLIFNYDELIDGSGLLYVTEGAFDALSIGPACALSDSHLSEWKLEELRKAAARGRRIVFVIDKNEPGFNLGLLALKEGWSIAVMPDGIDDANGCRIKFGRLWLLNHLVTTQVTGVAGEVLLRMKCIRRQTHKGPQ